MKIVNDEIKHYREAKIFFDKFDIERILAAKAAEFVKFDGAYKVAIEEDTAGSPSYKVGYKATVTLTEDLTKNEN